MRVLYVVNGILGSGGLERVLLHKASYMCDEYKYTIRILVLNEPLGKPFYPISPAVEVRHFYATGSAVEYFFKYRKGLRDAVEQFQPDVVSICDDGFKGLLAPLLLPRARPALVYERHISLELMPSLWKKLAMRLLARLYDRFVLLTPSNEKEWRVANTVIIPNPLPEFQCGKPQKRKKQILCIGTLCYRKGYDLLIEAWAIIASRYPEWSVKVYGSGDASPYQALADSRNLTGRIEFHPPVADIGARYNESGIFVLPSRFEGFGMVLLEAMSFGMPCISFDCPSGPRDILTDGVDGLLVSAGDPVALANSIEDLIKHPERRKSLGQQARLSVRRYEIAKIAASWDQLFSSLVISNG